MSAGSGKPAVRAGAADACAGDTAPPTRAPAMQVPPMPD